MLFRSYEDPLDEIREVLAYAWLHTEPPAVISRALWSGSWRECFDYEEDSPAATLALLGEWRTLRERIVGLLNATEIRIQTKPRGTTKTVETPPSVISPTLLTQQISIVAEILGEGREVVKWEIPIWEAWQIYHDHKRRDGNWTVPGKDRYEVEESFEGFELSDE